jgi:transcriptional regulator with XRE-family HTH domain
LDSKPLPRTSLEPVCEALAGVIRRRGIKGGLSLNRLAALTLLSRQMLSFIETNRRVPTIDTVTRISRAFGLPCSRLVAEAERQLS